jgi:hypothetical protein
MYQHLTDGKAPNVSALFGNHQGILPKAMHENCCWFYVSCTDVYGEFGKERFTM